jgi:hypothetical protein
VSQWLKILSKGPFIIYTWGWYRRVAKNTVNLPNLNIGQNNVYPTHVLLYLINND